MEFDGADSGLVGGWNGRNMVEGGFVLACAGEDL